MSIVTTCPRTENTAKVILPAQTILNVSYGKDSMQRLDVYLPEGRSIDNTKSIILIHGGGWNGGNKSDFVTYVDSFRKRLPAYAIFNINYRLVNPGNLFPTQENDIRQAIEFLASTAKEYHVNKEKFVLLGASAGAHLALLQAYKYSKPQVKAVIDFFGPTDLIAMYQNPWHPMVTYALQMITDATPNQNVSIYTESSPLHYVSTLSAPTLIFHGGKDNIVDISQSQLLKNKLKSVGVSHELVVYPRERHGWDGNTLSNSFDRIELFLKKHVQ